MRQRLRLFTGDEQSAAVAEPEVTISLGELARIMGDAVRSKRAWVRDFEDDQVQISADLYEVLSTYWNMRPGA